MSLIGEPADIGFARRFVRVYREKRAPVRVYEFEGEQFAERAMPRWAAAQIAWRQAWNAKGCGCG